MLTPQMKLKIAKVIDVIIPVLMMSLIITAISCEDVLEENHETFIIPKHSGLSKSQSLQSNVLNAFIEFDESSEYETEVRANQHDINKLIGLSECNSLHHFCKSTQ